MEPGSDLEYIALQKKLKRGAEVATEGDGGSGVVPMVTSDDGAETGEATGDAEGSGLPSGGEASSLPAGQDSAENNGSG